MTMLSADETARTVQILLVGLNSVTIWHFLKNIVKDTCTTIYELRINYSISIQRQNTTL